MPADPTTVTLRRDAQRNRQCLLDVADQAFGKHGVQASLDEVARRAGVGIGTLYRHFPTREALVEALVAADLERVAALADGLAGDTLAGIDGWLAELADHSVTYRGLAEALVTATGTSSALGDACTRLHDAGRELVRRAQRHGVVRDDADPSDAVDLASSIAWLTERDADTERRQRLLRAAVDGLRTTGTDELHARDQS